MARARREPAKAPIDVDTKTTAPVSKNVAVRNNNPMKKVLIANNFTGPVVIPRSVRGGKGAIHRISLGSLTFPSGTITQVDAEIWGKVKKENRMVRKYLEVGVLTEVKRQKSLVATISQTSNLVPPEHLQSPDNKTRLERAVVGEVAV